MKMLKSALLLILVIVGINIYLTVETTATLKTLKYDTQKALDAMQEDDFVSAKQFYSNFTQKLQEKNTLLKLQLPHETIEDVELDAATLHYYLDWEEKEDATICLETIKQKLHFIDVSQKLNWHNLF